MARPKRRQHVGDLLGEFAGRDEDQPARCLLPAPVRQGCQPGQQRQAEGQRLAGSGLGPAEHVAAGQRVGKRPGLDRERLADVTRGERPDQPGVQAELGEGGRGGRRRRGGGVQGEIELGVRFGAAAGVGSWRDRRAGGDRTRNDPGRGARKTRADAGKCAACGKLHRWFGGRMLDRRQQPRRPAGGSPAERRRRSPPQVQGYQPVWYSPAFPASTRMTSSSAVRCEPVTP